jgi:nitrite reductase (NADH) large subunit
MASARLCHELVAVGAIDDLDVIVVGRERRPAYDRVRLTSLLRGTRVEDILLASEAWYADAGISLLLGESAVEIDRDQCSVRTDVGREILYDFLVLATGSVPYVPPIPGTARPGVFVYRTVDDLETVRAFAAGKARAVVVGGGLLGLEAARAVADLGLRVDVVEAAPSLLARQLDRPGGLRLEELIRATGVHVHTGAAPLAIERGGDAALELRLAGGSTLPADLVILATGVRPASELAGRAGLAIAQNGGVAVDDRLRTSDDRIFAIGECASPEGRVYGLVAPGYRMVEVLVANMCGGALRFDLQTPVAKLDLFGIAVSSVGETNDDGAGVRSLAYETPAAYRRIFLREGRLAGAIAVGAWPGFDRAARAAQKRLWMAPWELRSFRNGGELWGDAPAPPPGEWPDDAIVCACNQITRAQIEQAYANGDAEGVFTVTRAGMNCGSCKPLVEELIRLAPPSSRRPVSSGRARPAGLIPAPDSARTGPPSSVPRRASMPPLRTVSRHPPPSSGRERGRSILLVSAALAALAVIAMAVVAPLPTAASALARPLTTRFTERSFKLWTGYGALGLVALSLLLSARKRLRFFRALDVGAFRAAHTLLAVLAIATAAAHTGLRLGTALNRVLMIDFLAAAAFGLLTATVFGTSHRLGAVLGRDLRLRASALHVVIVWPLPILLALHVVAAYFYG